MLESALRKKITKHLKSMGAWSYHPHGTAASMAGVPDLLVCYPGACPNCGHGPIGMFLGLEVKRPGKTATELQSHTLEEITVAGGVSSVITSVEEANAILQRVNSEPKRGNDDPKSFTRRQICRSARSRD